MPNIKSWLMKISASLYFSLFMSSMIYEVSILFSSDEIIHVKLKLLTFGIKCKLELSRLN